MDLIQTYHDQESQSSSSCDGPILVDTIENVAKSNNASRPRPPQKDFHQQQPLQPPPSPPPPHNGTNGRQLHCHMDRLPKNQPTNFAQWLTDIDKRVHSCLGSLNVLHKNTILESMDYFISKLTKDYNKLIKPKIAEHLSNYIRTYLYVYRYLYRSFEMGKRYFKRVIKILAIYTDMELLASVLGKEYDVTIAERIQFMYQTHLQVSDQNMVLDVFLNMKRLWRRHRGILSLLLQHFLLLTEPIEYADLLFIKNLIVFKRWLYIEEVAEERDKIRQAFVKFVKPKKTICMNSLFKPYLPVDGEGFVRIENLSNVLDAELSVGLLTRVLRKAEESTELQAKEVLIVLTDDEDEVPTNEFAQLNSNSHHSFIDDLSNDFDGQSSISTHSTHTSNEIMMLDTLSIDTLPSQLSAVSQHSIDLTTDNTTSMSECVNTVEDSSDYCASATTLCVPSDVMSLNSSNEYANTNDVPLTDAAIATGSNDTIAMLCHELDTGQNCANEIPPLDQTVFNNLVNNINETQMGESFAYVALNTSSMNGFTRSNNYSADKPPSPPVTRHEMSCQTTISLPIHANGNNVVVMPRTSTEMAVLMANDCEANEPVNAVNGLIVPDQVLVETVTKRISVPMNTSISNASLENHQETFLQLDEILTADLNAVETPIDPKPIENERITNETTPQQTDASDALTQNNNASTDSMADQVVKETDAVEVADVTPPKTPVVNNSLTETELLSRSEQELLYNEDDDAFVMDIFSFGNDSAREGTSKRLTASPSMSIDDRPPIWMRNGINNPPKTYSKIRKEKSDAKLQTVTITHPVTASVNAAKRPADDEDSFLMDIFCSNEVRTRLNDSKPLRTDNVYSSSTPKLAMTPLEKLEMKANRETAEPDKRARKSTKKIKSPTKVPSPKKATKKSETKGNSKRQPKSPKTPKTPKTPTSTKKTTPNRTRATKKSRLSKNMDLLLSAAPPTILTRQTYSKPLTHQTSVGDCDDSYVEHVSEKLHLSGNLFSSSFGQRPNGKFSAKKNASSTILERKTYIKASASTTLPSNTSSSVQSQPYDSYTSGSSTTNNNYSGNATTVNNTSYVPKNDKTRFGSVVGNDSVELDYLKNLFSGDFDSSKGIRNPIKGLNPNRSTEHLSATASAQKHHKLSSEFSDTDEMDDSTGYNTRKSKRSRKRPKKLDL